MLFDKAIVTGAAGFVGSNLVDALLSVGVSVTGFDNFQTGKPEFLREARKNSAFEFVEVDLKEFDGLSDYLSPNSAVFHMAANADIKDGFQDVWRDFKENSWVTLKLLEDMKAARCKKLIFASTGSVYGEPEIHPTPEDAPFPSQTSLYAASKVYCEGLISAFAEKGFIDATIFRFVSLTGPRYSHGHIFDFYKSLRSNPNELTCLGNGFQTKSYLHIEDCIRALLWSLNVSESPMGIYNLGTAETCTVRNSIGWITDELGLSPKIHYGRSKRGWVGDSPHILLKTDKMLKNGWQPVFSIEEGVRHTVRYLQNNEWLIK